MKKQQMAERMAAVADGWQDSSGLMDREELEKYLK